MMATAKKSAKARKVSKKMAKTATAAVVTEAEAPAAIPASGERTWSSEQNAIFEWCANGTGNLIVRARAGTGKTTTILEGVKRMPEGKILLAAFNKSIATELQARVNDPRVEAKTLHGLGFAFLRQNWKVRIDEKNERGLNLARRACGADAPFPILKLVRDLHGKARDMAPELAFGNRNDLRDMASLATRFDLLPEDGWKGWDARRVCESAIQAMKFAAEWTATIDFADMIFLPIYHGWVRPWYDAVLVDEAQDMTSPQLYLATASCRAGGRVCVVGDDRQAIYGFRGADSGSIDRLKEELGAVELSLATTYRCPKLVVAMAAELVPGYTAAPNAPDGEIVGIDEDRMLDAAAEGDFIISRTNAPLVSTCLALLKRGTRAQIKGRDIGKGILALINKLGARTIPEIRPAIEGWVVNEMARAADLPEEAREARSEVINDQADLVLALAEGCADLAEMTRRCEDLFADNPNRGAVLLSTVHRVKGLEADTVYLLEKTFRPLTGEESNVRYVAITRAKRRLVLVRESDIKAAKRAEAERDADNE